MSLDKITIKQVIVPLLFSSAGLLYICSFFLPAVNYYGGPIYGYQMIISPLILLVLVPNTFVILTFFKYKKLSMNRKILFLIIVLFSAGFYSTTGLSSTRPTYKDLLSGHWLWLCSSVFIMLISVLESLFRTIPKLNTPFSETKLHQMIKDL